MKVAFRAVAIFCLLGITAWGAEPFQAGAATSNITPPIGLEIIGGFVPFPSRQIHDELHARCLVLDDGTTRLALVVCDLLGIHRAVSDEARRRITEKTGIPRENVMISATHTHSAASALGQDRLQPDQGLDEYQNFVASRIADGVTRALNNRRPAQVAIGTVDIPEHVFNRRWHMRPGTVPPNPFGTADLVKMNPPAGSPNLVEPAGPIDPAVSLISVRTVQGRPIAVLSTYSLHYVGGVGSAEISADYYGVYCARLQQLVTAEIKPDGDQPPFVALMANGTSGDINNINFQNPRPGKKPYEQIQFVAEDLAEKVKAALTSLKYQDHAILKACYREPEIAWRHPTAEQRKWAEETIAAGAKSPSDLSYIYAQRAMKLAGYPESTTIPLQTLRIGDLCIGTMPCEVFCEIGLEFKSQCPIQPAFMIELAHGYFGYLPTPRQLKLGGYETWIGTNRLEPDASEKLLKTLLEMAAELK
ncbi:MAG: neutral/alkaline non-lysosomal ceramidase N-terminal domain-containing protein [Planctomycetes bacterium]|nr:neutral/alkaline non-lysosomal ceramidase N-terminal domain-containing protein [Planctomycetota bacterium]